MVGSAMRHPSVFCPQSAQRTVETVRALPLLLLHRISTGLSTLSNSHLSPRLFSSSSASEQPAFMAHTKAQQVGKQVPISGKPTESEGLRILHTGTHTCGQRSARRHRVCQGRQRRMSARWVHPRPCHGLQFRQLPALNSRRPIADVPNDDFVLLVRDFLRVEPERGNSDHSLHNIAPVRVEQCAKQDATAMPTRGEVSGQALRAWAQPGRPIAGCREWLTSPSFQRYRMVVLPTSLSPYMATPPSKAAAVFPMLARGARK